MVDDSLEKVGLNWVDALITSDAATHPITFARFTMTSSSLSFSQPTNWALKANHDILTLVSILCMMVILFTDFFKTNLE